MAALISLVVSDFSPDSSFSHDLHFTFFVMQSRYMLFFVFSHVAVRIDASATYRVRVVYIYLVPRVLRFSPSSTSLFCFVIVITFAVHGHCFQRISTSSLVQR